MGVGRQAALAERMKAVLHRLYADDPQHSAGASADEGLDMLGAATTSGSAASQTRTAHGAEAELAQMNDQVRWPEGSFIQGSLMLERSCGISPLGSSCWDPHPNPPPTNPIPTTPNPNLQPSLTPLADVPIGGARAAAEPVRPPRVGPHKASAIDAEQHATQEKKKRCTASKRKAHVLYTSGSLGRRR